MRNLLLIFYCLLLLSSCRTERDERVPLKYSGPYIFEKYQTFTFNASTNEFDVVETFESCGEIILVDGVLDNGDKGQVVRLFLKDPLGKPNFNIAFKNGVNITKDFFWELETQFEETISIWQINELSNHTYACVYSLRKKGKTIVLSAISGTDKEEITLKRKY